MAKVTLDDSDAQMLADVIRWRVPGDYEALHLLAELLITESTIELEIDE